MGEPNYNQKRNDNRRYNNNKGGNYNKGKNNKPQRKFVKNPDPMGDTQSMGRYMMKIIRDISRGKFDFNAHGHVFANREFMDAGFIEINQRIGKLNVQITAINGYYANNMGDPLVQSTLNDLIRSHTAYSIVWETLQKIAVTGDISFIGILGNNLSRYRHDL